MIPLILLRSISSLEYVIMNFRMALCRSRWELQMSLRVILVFPSLAESLFWQCITITQSFQHNYTQIARHWDQKSSLENIIQGWIMKS